ncbi:Uncharacterised protein r2_g4063 [Pycnogonum litorale]
MNKNTILATNIMDVPRRHAHLNKDICCRLNTKFLVQQSGFCKILEIICCGVCLTLCLNFGGSVASILGASYYLFITISSSLVTNTTLLTLTYILSQSSYLVIRSNSIFEWFFNLTAAILYLIGSTYLLVISRLVLWPMYLVIPYFQPFPAITAASFIGYLCSIVYAIDFYYAYRFYKGRKL